MSPGPIGTGYSQACTTISDAPRRAASWYANPTAAVDSSEPSTPTTTGPSARASPRVTSTGQCARADTWSVTEPISRPANPPSPR